MAYTFVVWKGNVYEVTEEEVKEVGEVFGKVKRGVNERTGEYFGNASNGFKKGTKYYEIKGVSPNSAVEDQTNHYLKAVYAHESTINFLL
ncbi:hypothetical protein [Mesobacillus harenae]|uniref:hypothetical protein n=1 Tax=Mesobacillus harenae TaxID=2213203 RepID=UPI0015807D48|nr:hypothetical protein [Mesobacillus harenae]